MKIHSDFVTNSSSSSFILGFRPGESINEILAANYEGEYLSEAIREVKINTFLPRETEELVRALLEEDSWYNVIKSLSDEIGPKKAWSYHRDHPEDFKRRQEKFIEQEYEKIMSSEYDRISIVEWEDHSCIGNEMEHEVFPALPCTLARISHH